MGMNEIIEKCTGRLECTFVSSLNSDEYYIAHTDAVGGFLSEDKEPLSQIVFAKNIIDDDRAMAAAFCRELISLKEPVSDDFALRENRYKIEFRIILDDMVRWVRLTCMVYCGDDNNPESIVGRMHFMTPSEIMKVRALQIHGVGKSQADYLEDIRALIDSCGAQRVVLVQFDIVNFKYINTQYSEKEGNEVLDYVSRKLDEMCGDSCVHFRMSADIFLVAAVFNGMSDVERIVYNIENDISECDGIRLRYAFGVYIAEDKSVSVRTMCDCASMAR
ncbi:MAG: diguanylate cyclase [Oscillospiraceae bacterium]|nr:diguanylate cyclase [Oscillospiraceae bacterium]